MAITCSFKKSYGSALMWDSTHTQLLKLDIWADGNCDAVFTYGKQKSLAFFINDAQHLKMCAKEPNLFSDIKKLTLYSDFKPLSRFVKYFTQCGVEVTIKRR